MKRRPKKPPIEDCDWKTDEQLCTHFNLPSTRIIANLRARGKIPFTKFGYRTIRYSLKACTAAIAKLERKAVGQ